MLAGVLCIWGTSALGFWQLRRAAAKEAMQQVVEAAAIAAPTAPSEEALADPATLANRHLLLTGTWLPDRVVYLDNRSMDGQAGFYVLMALRLAGRDIEVIVNRGWTPRNGADRARIHAYATAGGLVTLTGIAYPDEPRLMELAQPGDRRLGGIWQNFDFDAFRRASGGNPLPIVVRQDATSSSASLSLDEGAATGGQEADSPGATDRPADGAAAPLAGSSDSATPTSGDRLRRDWPDRGSALRQQIDRHHGYAFQWFALAVTLAAILVFQLYRFLRHVRIPHR